MRILLVEDNSNLQRSLSRALKNALFAVDIAGDGQEGLEKAMDNEYDAILLDVMLPVFDGWDVLKRLRESKITPVIMLTAQDAVDDRIRGLDLGADDYLPKPFQIDELLARLRAVIRRSAGQATSTLQLGDFNLDLKAKQLSRAGERISVPAREYNLIEYLALHRGEVISRTELYDHIFGEEDSTLSNVLDVNVSRVRSKFGKDFIVTHRGHGYSIE